MPSKAPEFKLRADLRQPARVSSETGMPGAWWIWCLFGLTMGLCGWLACRHVLRQQLSRQLANAETAAEALEAVEGLLKLDERGPIELVAGLEHSDIFVARSAFQALDRSIGNWRTLDPSEQHRVWQSLASRLSQVSSSTPSEHLILASSLAARIYADCLAANDPRLQTTMELCQVVIQRAGQSLGSARPTSAESSADEGTLAAIDRRIALLAPPPPLPSNATESQQKAPTAEDHPPPALATAEPGPTALAANGSWSTELAAGTQDEFNPTLSQYKSPMASNDPALSSGDSASLSSSSHRMSLSDMDSRDPPSLAMDLVALKTKQDADSKLAAAELADADAENDLSFHHDDSATDNSPKKESVGGVDNLPIAELVRLLASVQPRIAQAATLALRRHGMTDDKLELASELATGTVQQRARLIEAVASRGDLDPRPWLLWMAQDGQPEIRKQAVAYLTNMLDVDVLRQLRMLLNREQDETVANAIRQALLAPNLTQQSILR